MTYQSQNMNLHIKSIKFTLFLTILLFLSIPAFAQAALPTGFSLETVASGLNLPTTFDFAPDGRIFVAEKNGSVRVIEDGKLLESPFITLPNVNTWADRGLIGLAIDPNFDQNGWVYLSYTYENSPDVYEGPKMAQIVRVKADSTGNVAIPGSMEVLVGSVVGDATTPSCNSFATGTDCIPSDSPSHSAGGLRFGPDGKLWATIGDGASFAYIDDNAYKAQDPDWLLGKVLRLNTDGTAPADNPFYTGDPTDNRSKVYATGIRNSFRFNFRPSNDSLYAGEVGWGGWEEINVVNAGDNFGWPCREGMGLQGGYQCTAPEAKDPIYTYPNDGGASIVGGDFAGAAYPAPYEGSYFFGDFYRSQLSRMVIGDDDLTIITNEFWLDGDANGPVAINAAPDGSIYYAAIYTGEIVHLKYTSGSGTNQPPTARNDNATALADQVTYISLLANDTDPEDNPLTLGDLTQPNFGEVYNNGDNTVTYAPPPDFTGTDEFSYIVSDGSLTDSAVVTVDVRPYGDPTQVNITHLSLTQNVATPVVAETTVFSATVRNDGQAGSFLVDFELYDANTQSLESSKVFNNEYLDAGETKTFNWSWTPQTAGDYWLSVGYMSPDWSILHHWEDKGLQFVVNDRKPTTPPELVIDSIELSSLNVNLGDPITATVNIRNVGGTGEGLVDIEVTNEANDVVHMEFFNNEPFNVGEVRTFSTNWTPTELGHFYVDAGTFDADWQAFQNWMWHGAEFDVLEGTSSTDPKYVYNDSLSTDWASWSWDTAIDFSDTSSPYVGQNDMSVTYGAPWGGVYLRSNANFSKGAYTDLSLTLNGNGGSGQDLMVKIIDPNGNILAEDFIPTLSDSWSTFNLPLSSLDSNDLIAGIMVMGRTGEIIDPYLIDEMRFE